MPPAKTRAKEPVPRVKTFPKSWLRLSVAAFDLMLFLHSCLPRHPALERGQCLQLQRCLSSNLNAEEDPSQLCCTIMGLVLAHCCFLCPVPGPNHLTHQSPGLWGTAQIQSEHGDTPGSSGGLGLSAGAPCSASPPAPSFCLLCSSSRAHSHPPHLFYQPGDFPATNRKILILKPTTHAALFNAMQSLQKAFTCFNLLHLARRF